jgi:hypothetical protein
MVKNVSTILNLQKKNNLPLLDKLNKCGLATEYLSELFPYLVFDENGRKKRYL